MVQSRTVEKPIFIVGTGRCGSTILHHVLSYHDHVAWLSRVCDMRPSRPQTNRWALRTLDLPLLSRYLRKLIYPAEAYRFWSHYFPGFVQPCRDLLKEDVTLKVKADIRNVMAQMLTRKRHRLLIKITGWPRIGFLKEIFPDAKFIHVYRDGRAVVNSMLHVFFWSGWHGPSGWRWGELSPAQRKKWVEYDRSFVALAAIEWEMLMAAQEQAKHRIASEDLLEIRYEDMCADPVATLQHAIAFSDLAWSPSFESVVRNTSFANTNHKWRKQLSEAQQNILEECLSDTLRDYGYA